MALVKKDNSRDSLCILIPVYNKLEYTKKCLTDLQREISKFSDTIKIVVIDDGSTDGTGEWIHDHHPEVTVLKGTGNLFWSGAMNMGIKFAFYENDFDYILLWNNDVHTGNDYFNKILEILKLKPQGIVGSKILTLIDKSIVWSYGGYFDPGTGKRGVIGYFDKDKEEYSKIRNVDWITGMGTLIHRDVVKKIGLMDEKHFPQYFGDTDFTYRAKTAGFQVIMRPDLIIYNDTSNTGFRPQNGFHDLVKSLFSIRSNLSIKSNVLFLKKHSASLFAYLNLSAVYFRVIGGFIKWKILSLFGKHRSSQHYYNSK